MIWLSSTHLYKYLNIQPVAALLTLAEKATRSILVNFAEIYYLNLMLKKKWDTGEKCLFTADG